MLLEISQNSQENTCHFIKKQTLARVFSCEFREILRTPFLQNTFGRLLLFLINRLTLKSPNRYNISEYYKHYFQKHILLALITPAKLTPAFIGVIFQYSRLNFHRQTYNTGPFKAISWKITPFRIGVIRTKKVKYPYARKFKVVQN